MMSPRFTLNTLGLVALIGTLHGATGPALAQEDEQATTTLKAGDEAPPLTAEKWIKGAPVTSFEKGSVYVVEFWATWCGPCISSMPRLSAIQKNYRNQGVTVIGVDVWEGKEYSAETLKKVQDFVKEQGQRMSYTVAYDGKERATDTAYMKAARRNGIPTTFLVDKTGKIAWIGHPMWLDLPLEAVVADKWDPKTGPEQIAKGAARLNEVYEKMRTAPKEAVAAWEGFEREYPAVAHALLDTKFTVLLVGGKYDQAYELGRQLVDEAIANKDGNALNGIAWQIVDPEGEVARKDLDLALKAAVKADEFTKHENAAIIDTLARAHFLQGDINRAIELQRKAVELAKGPMKEQLQKVLVEYQEAQAKS